MISEYQPPQLPNCSPQHRGYQQTQSQQEKHKHGDHAVGGLGSPFWFLSAQLSPNGGDHDPAVSEAIGDGRLAALETTPLEVTPMPLMTPPSAPKV
jgi:hypothetical protein